MPGSKHHPSISFMAQDIDQQQTLFAPIPRLYRYSLFLINTTRKPCLLRHRGGSAQDIDPSVTDRRRRKAGETGKNIPGANLRCSLGLFFPFLFMTVDDTLYKEQHQSQLFFPEV